MKIHRAGFKIIRNTVLIVLLLGGLSCYFVNNIITVSIILLILALLLTFVLRFFRLPKREILALEESTLLSPCDGTVCAIEEVFEDEFLKTRVIQVSVFMSVWNVHANWFPLAGVVKYYKYHSGKFLMAWNPKSSEENERTTCALETKGFGVIVFRQIAGFVARRIEFYSKEGEIVEKGQEIGFIKFGSRVDLFLPIDSKINVKLKDKVTGQLSVIATRLKKDTLKEKQEQTTQQPVQPVQPVQEVQRVEEVQETQDSQTMAVNNR